MSQDPRTDAEFADFCSTQYDVSFPLFSKISVAGEQDVLWNFEKFVIGKDSPAVGRFNPVSPPDDPALIA